MICADIPKPHDPAESDLCGVMLYRQAVSPNRTKEIVDLVNIFFKKMRLYFVKQFIYNE